jgi:hypothetical protein
MSAADKIMQQLLEKLADDRAHRLATINSADVIAGLEMALAQAEAMIERQQHVMQRAVYAWDTTTHQKNGDGRLWQCMEELRGECIEQARIDKQRADTAEARLAEVKRAIADLLLYFKSGNSIPVEKATIKAGSPEIVTLAAFLGEGNG